MLGRVPASARRWRAGLIVAAVLLAVAGAAVAGWQYARESTPVRGPILLISVHGLSPDAVPLDPRRADATMPAIRALAAQAVAFERAYTHSPLSLPAHASLLAGQLPFEHGVRDEAGFALKDEARLLPELLRGRGFETGAAVSSFLLRPESGVAQGFSFFDAELPGRADAGPVVQRDGAQTIEAAVRWLRSRRDRRFFLFVQVDDGAADAAVARLVDELKARALYEESTIVLTADRADAAHRGWLDESALRVPLLVKQPGSRGAGRRVAVPVQHIDILPTMLDLVRAPVPPGLRGYSLRNLLERENAALPARPIYAESLAEHFRLGAPAKFVLADSDHLYIRAGQEALIDLQRGEPAALPAENADAERLRGELDRLLEGRPVEQPAEILPAEEDHYAALGYLGGVPGMAPEPPPLDPDEEARILDAHREAAILASQKNYGAAIEHLRQIARAHPAIVAVRYQLGVLLARTGRLQDAETAFRAAALREPDNPYIPIALAGVLVRAGRGDEARDRAALAVALAERQDARARAAAHDMAARVALVLDDHEQAELHAQAIVRERPTVPMAQFVRGRLLHAQGRYREALTLFEEAAALTREHGRPIEELYWYYGDTLARLDRLEDAEAEYREELRSFPRNLRAYSSLAMLYRASNRAGAVEDVLDALIEAAPTPEGYDIAARLWAIVGEPSRAAEIRADARARFR